MASRFSFQPMTNDDIITCLLFLDDVTLENGPLEVIPGSHKGPLYSHWHDGVFTGAVDPNIVAEQKNKIVSCAGKAGSVCLMHAAYYMAQRQIHRTMRGHFISPLIMLKMRLNLVPIIYRVALRTGKRRGNWECAVPHMKCHCQLSQQTHFLRSRRASGKMKLKLHHINLSTNNLSGMDHFYRNVLGRGWNWRTRFRKNKGYDGHVAFVSDGHIELAQDLNINFERVMPSIHLNVDI